MKRQISYVIIIFLFGLTSYLVGWNRGHDIGYFGGIFDAIHKVNLKPKEIIEGLK